MKWSKNQATPTVATIILNNFFIHLMNPILLRFLILFPMNQNNPRVFKYIIPRRVIENQPNSYNIL